MKNTERMNIATHLFNGAESVKGMGKTANSILDCFLPKKFA